MPIGVLTIPGWFQYIITSLFKASGVDAASAFLDNITIGGTTDD